MALTNQEYKCSIKHYSITPIFSRKRKEKGDENAF
jgi:hypothetical protein